MFFGKKKAEQVSAAQAERKAGEERRKHARYQTAVVTCSLGDLKDLSRSGLRVLRAGPAVFKPGQGLAIELYSPSDTIELKAKVVRATKLPGARWEITLEFVELTAGQPEMIENLAKYGVARSPNSSNVSENARKLVAALRMPDHYKALGIARKASADEVQKAFRGLARQYHPDVNSDPQALTIFQAINAAHEVLSDSEQRARYDEITSFGEAA